MTRISPLVFSGVFLTPFRAVQSIPASGLRSSMLLNRDVPENSDSRRIYAKFIRANNNISTTVQCYVRLPARSLAKPICPGTLSSCGPSTSLSV
ncbi:hypothetical protein C8F04DRAFT_109482 [Mycena alexandri]|uniref:Uncharacterized protein n=1 Tax=Mycena alexandri TaxID=1745969 RepID=A0AAD6SG10_9AGAR|nr:hypothetical protein C8F04DRAFT_109482 [Mycena alexandri]